MRPREVGAFKGGIRFWLSSYAPTTSGVGPEEGLLFLGSLTVLVATVIWHTVLKMPPSEKGVEPSTPCLAAPVLQLSAPDVATWGFIHSHPCFCGQDFPFILWLLASGHFRLTGNGNHFWSTSGTSSRLLSGKRPVGSGWLPSVGKTCRPGPRGVSVGRLGPRAGTRGHLVTWFPGGPAAWRAGKP